MKEKTAEQKHQFELLKSPIVAEFLGFRTEDSFAESDLESAILSHIRDFLMEMGKGFAFVARQQHIVTDTEDYYIDLVFYNIELKCYVLIDLKMGTITHQDVGQIDMYVRMYDELKCKEGDNPTILYAACFDANGGLFEPLFGEEDAIISDALNHASIIDGVRLCKAKRYRYANADMADLERCLQEAQAQRHRIIATDGVFSMDGNVAPMDKICELAEKYDALVMVNLISVCFRQKKKSL